MLREILAELRQSAERQARIERYLRVLNRTMVGAMEDDITDWQDLPFWASATRNRLPSEAESVYSEDSVAALAEVKRDLRAISEEKLEAAERKRPPSRWRLRSIRIRPRSGRVRGRGGRVRSRGRSRRGRSRRRRWSRGRGRESVARSEGFVFVCFLVVFCRLL